MAWPVEITSRTLRIPRLGRNSRGRAVPEEIFFTHRLDRIYVPVPNRVFRELLAPQLCVQSYFEASEPVCQTRRPIGNAPHRHSLGTYLDRKSTRLNSSHS